MLRAATDDDVDAIVALARAEETAWFGEPENSPDEVADWLRHSGGVTRGVVVDDGSGVRGFATISPDRDTALVVDSSADAPPYDALMGWLRENGATHLEVFSTDNQRATWLREHGWAHTRSSFDLLRPGADALEPPEWPDGVEVRVFDRDADAEAVHHLVYVEAKWAEIPGHTERPFETWAPIFADPQFHGWVAWRGDLRVGWAVGRVSAEGLGLINQIAVSGAERRNGLGRALLLHGFTELLVQGATSLALNVQAANERAIGLYRSIGLEIEREWQIFEPA